MRKFYVATTKHQQENSAAANLREQGYEVYLPKRYTRVEGRRADVLVHLRYSNYLMVAFDLALDEHGPISNTRGIGELICTRKGDQLLPQALPPDWVEEMRRFEDEEFGRAAARNKPTPRTDITPGDQVEIADIESMWHTKRGELMRVENFEARVLVGMVIVRVPEVNLRKVGAEGSRAA